MEKLFFRRCLAVILLFSAESTIAQERLRPGTLLLSGYRPTCGPIETIVMHMNDIAKAGGGRIFLNPSIFRLPRAEQLFWYTHECAHHIFGPGEARADCWSVEQGRIQGWLSPKEFERLGRRMQRHMGDATHAAGPQRVAFMKTCYER